MTLFTSLPLLLPPLALHLLLPLLALPLLALPLLAGVARRGLHHQYNSYICSLPNLLCHALHCRQSVAHRITVQ
jgi:hypothetical protein